MSEYRLITDHARSVGDVTAIAWRAWWCETTLRWELRRLLPTVGLTRTSAGSAPHVQIRKSMAGIWLKAFNALGLHMTDHISKSSKANKVSGVQSGEQLAWCSTMGLLLVLMAWCHGRKEVEGRMHSMQALERLLAATTQSSCQDTLSSCSDRTLCAVDVNDENVCVHLQVCLHAKSNPLLARPARWVQFLLSCYPPPCDAVRQMLCRQLQSLAREIDDGRALWCAAAHLHTPALQGPSGKARNVDEAVKKRCLQEARPSEQQRYWHHRHLLSLLNSGARLADGENHISIAFDAGRIRKPTADVNLCLCYLHGSRCAIVLPPMVPPGPPKVTAQECRGCRPNVQTWSAPG